MTPNKCLIECKQVDLRFGLSNVWKGSEWILIAGGPLKNEQYT